MPSYKVLTGIDYDGRRAEPGSIITDLPARSVKWLLEQGIVEAIEDKPQIKSEPPKSPPAKRKGDDD